MATYNLDAIRRRIQELNTGKKLSNIQLWKPQVGKHKIRALPWKENENHNESPIIELDFYWLGSNSILAPKQFGKADPVNELARKLYSSGVADDKITAKKLRPSTSAFLRIVDRNDKEKGVQLWKFSKKITTKLLGYLGSEDIIDFLDPDEGYDLDVSITQTPGKKYPDTDVEAARKVSKLSSDPELAQQWLKSTIHPNDLYKEKTYEEIVVIVEKWLAAGAPSNNDGDLGMKKEVSEEVHEVPTKVEVQKQKKSVDVDEVVPKKSLNDAFDELMKD